MNHKVRRLAILGMLTALMLILGLTPIGYIKIPPVEITLMCIPVIIATLVEGIGAGLFLGAVFAGTSLAQVFLAPVGLAALFYVNPVKMLFIIVLPRLAIPVVTYLIAKAFRLQEANGKKKTVGMTIAALAGSLTNTILFLGMTLILFSSDVAQVLGVASDAVMTVIGGVVLTNGLPEALAAALICVPVTFALKKAFRASHGVC